jgi:hypothetical protein
MTTLKGYLWLGLLLMLAPPMAAAAEIEWLVAPYAWLPDKPGFNIVNHIGGRRFRPL